MAFMISYGCVKKLLPTINPWNRVFWLERGDGLYDLYLGLSGGTVFHSQIQGADVTDFESHAVSGAEITTTVADSGEDDGFALATKWPIGLL